MSERFDALEYPCNKCDKRDVSIIVNAFSKISIVEQVISSSVTSACNLWSDIDVDDRFMFEIYEKGVVVYER